MDHPIEQPLELDMKRIVFGVLMVFSFMAATILLFGALCNWLLVKRALPLRGTVLAIGVSAIASTLLSAYMSRWLYTHLIGTK